MTFTEAAVEVLRRAGKPLHYREIAEAAVRENLLSHVGQDPESTMGHRLAAMAKREEERRVVAVDPDGTFALTEWAVPAEQIVEPVPPPPPPQDDGKQYRPREREPRAINAQARRRIEAIQSGEEVSEQAEKRERHAGQRRFPPPAEVVFEWLAQRGSGAPLAEAAAELVKKGLLSDGLLQELHSLTAALLEDNRRRTEVGRKPAFIVDGERVSLVEFPPPAAIPDLVHSPHSGLGRPVTAAALVAEGRRAVVRALRSRLADLETAGFEQVCAALLDKMGMRDLRVAKRNKEGSLYLARQRRGVSDLRVAVRLVRGKREISRADVQELRKDLAHYSSQMALLLSPGEAGRESRSEASAAAQPPVALYAGEALAEELLALRVGVTVQVVEVADVDEAFFASATKAQARDRRDGERSDERHDAPSGEPAGETPQAAQAAAAPAPVAAPAPPPAHAAAAPAAPAAEERRPEERGRRGRRDEKPKLLSPADQAWGQPAGTPRKGAQGAPLAEVALSEEAVEAAPVVASAAAAVAAEGTEAASGEAAPAAVAPPEAAAAAEVPPPAEPAVQSPTP